MRRKATVADTGLHDFKDLQKAALTSPLSGEGIFGPDFEKKLKDRQEKDKQLSELMPEMNKKQFMKGNQIFKQNQMQRKPGTMMIHTGHSGTIAVVLAHLSGGRLSRVLTRLTSRTVGSLW